MHDLVIRNATIVDGTGAPARAGDLALDGGIIASAGGKAGAGRRETAHQPTPATIRNTAAVATTSAPGPERRGPAMTPVTSPLAFAIGAGS